MPLIEVGSKVPAFSLPDQNGKLVSQLDLAGKPYVLYFYPKDDTSSCTAQACSFSDSIKMFEKCNARVIGISPDGVKSHGKFASKYKLAITLLADEAVGNASPSVCEAFGVWGEKSMYGKKYMGVIRTTYLIGADGRVAQRWDAVKVPGHADVVLAALSGGSPTQDPKSSVKKATKKTSKSPATNTGGQKTVEKKGAGKKLAGQKASGKGVTGKKGRTATASKAKSVAKKKPSR